MLEENSLDYICVGSSHAYCTVNPLEIWKQTGLRGFVLGTQTQPLEASYHYIVEAFKTQSPKVVILEGYMAKLVLEQASGAALFDAIDPIPFSKNKVDMINCMIPEGEREAYFFNVLKYHTRWKELLTRGTSNFFNLEISSHKGYYAFEESVNAINRHSDYEKVKEIDLDKQNLEYLNKIQEFVELKGAKLVIMLAPYETNNPDVAGRIKSERIWATEKGIQIIDYSLLLDELEINPKTDYYDTGHLNVSGARKASRYLANSLLEVGLVPQKNECDEIYSKDYNAFIQAFPEK